MKNGLKYEVITHFKQSPERLGFDSPYARALLSRYGFYVKGVEGDSVQPLMDNTTEPHGLICGISRLFV